MNKIKIKQLFIAGLVTLMTFILVEFLVESIFERLIFRHGVNEFYLSLGIQHWDWVNNLVNILIALLNTTMLVWLYAALRPMFGVGLKTALITSLFGFVFASAYALNVANISQYPFRIALIEMVYLLVELPASMTVGAYIYERG